MVGNLQLTLYILELSSISTVDHRNGVSQGRSSSLLSSPIRFILFMRCSMTPGHHVPVRLEYVNLTITVMVKPSQIWLFQSNLGFAIAHRGRFRPSHKSGRQLHEISERFRSISSTYVYKVVQENLTC